MIVVQNKQRWSWLALRTARDVHLQHFGKIGTGDVLLLAQEIEKDIADKEEQKKTVMMDVQEEKTLSVQPGGPHDDRSVSPQPGNVGVSEQMDVKVESPDDK